MKKRLAIWIFGGVGTGDFSQGYPVLERLIQELATPFKIVVYSQSAPNPGYVNSSFIIRSPGVKIKYPPLRWLILVIIFLKDHSKKRFNGLLAFWGWPSGFIVTVLGKVLHLPNAVYVLGGDAAGISAINFGIFHRPFLRRIALWTYHQTHLLLAISYYQKDQLKSFGIGRAVCVIPWGADDLLYKFLLKELSNPVHFIHVGHLTPVKDQTTLLKAFALINHDHPSELRMFGGDFLNGTMKQLCNELGIQNSVQFLNMVPYQEMPKHYQWADLMMHTSLSEGQSMALTEAAASGVLLTGTRVGLLYDLTDHCGITVDTGDYRTLAKKIIDIISNRVVWREKIDRAKDWSERHTFHWTVAEINKQLDQLIR
ncbi:MAG: glycosyltransferase [Cyclobacteriaceae bacterium]